MIFGLRGFRKSRCFYNQVIEYLLDKIKIYEQGEEPIFEYTHDDSIKYIDFDSIINMRYEGEGKNLLEEINEITQKAINTAISEYLESDLKINLVNYSVEENNINEDRIKQQIDTAQEYLKFLNCEYKGKRFMSEGDYRRMLSWVEVLIRDGKCPEQAGILTLNHSKDWVKYTLYLIQKEVMNFKKDDEWVRLAWIIGGSEGEFSTIKTKFSTAPKVVRNRVGYDEVVSQLVKGGKIGGKI